MAKTGNFNLEKPANGSNGWGDAVNENFDIIDSKLKENADGLAEKAPSDHGHNTTAIISALANALTSGDFEALLLKILGSDTDTAPKSLADLKAHIAGTADKHSSDKISYDDGFTVRNVQAALRALEEDGSVDSDRIADGAITQAKLATELLTYIQENGGANSEDVDLLLGLFEASSNLYNPNEHDEPAGWLYRDAGVLVEQTAVLKSAGMISLEPGKTYTIWLKGFYEGSMAPPWDTRTLYMYAYDDTITKVPWSVTPELLFEGTAIKITMPATATKFTCTLSDNFYHYPTMEDFRSCIMLEEGDKTKFERYGLKLKQLDEFYSSEEINEMYNPNDLAWWLGKVKPQKNLFDKATMIVESDYIKLVSGEYIIGDAQDRASSDYISVLPNTSYYLTNPFYANAPKIFYNASKENIGSSTTNSFTTPPDCHFVRFSLYHPASMVEFADGTGVQLEQGESPTEYEDYDRRIEHIYTKSEIDNNYSEILMKYRNENSIMVIVQEEDDDDPDVLVKQAIYVRSPFSSTKDLVQKYINWETLFHRQHINLEDTFIVEKDSSPDVLTGVTIKGSSDDIAAQAFDNYTTGGNHGAQAGITITVVGHGLTMADVGSEWLDANNDPSVNSGNPVKFYIMRILNENEIILMSEDTHIQQGKPLFYRTITSPLTRSDAAETMTFNDVERDDNLNTDGIIVDTFMFPALVKKEATILLDGKFLVQTNGVYSCEHVDIIDRHAILSVTSQLAEVRKAYLENVLTLSSTNEDLSNIYKSATQVVSQEICYRHGINNTNLVINNWTAHEDINMFSNLFLMSSAMVIQGDETARKLYIPKSKIVDGNDVKNVIDITTIPMDRIDVWTEFWEKPSSPPDRIVEFNTLSDGSPTYGIAMGFDLTKGLSQERKDYIDHAMSVTTTGKVYMRGMTEDINPIDVERTYTMVGYRNYINYQDIGEATSYYYYELAGALIVYVDYHTTVKNAKHAIPATYIGKDVTVIEKTENVNVSEGIISTPNITVTCEINSDEAILNEHGEVANTYGYAVLKIS